MTVAKVVLVSAAFVAACSAKDRDVRPASGGSAGAATGGTAGVAGGATGGEAGGSGAVRGIGGATGGTASGTGGGAVGGNGAGANGPGIGDPCTSDADCATVSGIDVGCVFNTPPPGWCTVSCQVEGSADPDCNGKFAGGTNKFGEQNFCLADTSSNKRCWPGCMVSSAVCTNYAGAVCNPAVGGVKACW